MTRFATSSMRHAVATFVSVTGLLSGMVIAGEFKTALDINTISKKEALTIIDTPAAFQTDAIWGPIGSQLSGATWRALINKTSAVRVIAEQEIGHLDNHPKDQLNQWVGTVQRVPDAIMVYTEYYGTVQWIGGYWYVSRVPGFVPNPSAHFPDGTPQVWTQTLDSPVATNFVQQTGFSPIVLLNRIFVDQPWFPFRTQAMNSLTNPFCAGMAFEITAGEIATMRTYAITSGLKAVLATPSKQAFLLISPGGPHGESYSYRVRKIMNELVNTGVPLGNSRLTIVLAIYDSAGTVGFLRKDHGDDSIEAALAAVKSYKP